MAPPEQNNSLNVRAGTTSSAAPTRIQSLKQTSFLTASPARGTLSSGGTKTPKTKPQTQTDNGIITLRYEDSVPAKPPIAVTVAPPRAPPQDTHPALRRPISSSSRKHVENLGNADEERKRDSGLAPTTTSSKRGAGSVNTVDDNALGFTINFNSTTTAQISQLTMNPLQEAPATSVIEKPKDSPAQGDSNDTNGDSKASPSKWRKTLSRENSTPQTPPKSIETDKEEFSPITTPIPTDSLLDEGFLDALSFSKRGSIMWGGKKAANGHARQVVGRRQPSFSMLASPSTNLLSDDLEKESQKVRSMYEQGTAFDWEDGNGAAVTSPANIGEVISSQKPSIPNGHLSSDLRGANERPQSALSTTNDPRREHELAGGIEDWEDVRGGDVDRYGFINAKRDPLRPGTPEPRPPQRVSTVLQLASETPRKKRVFGRSPSTAASTNSRYERTPSRKVSARSLRTVKSAASTRSNSRTSMRAAANRLPGNRDRRWMDEAGDMLTLPPGLADIAEDEEGGKAVAGMKKKEWERSEKWRKMAKVVKTGKDGEGMRFEFDVRNSKLIERTWKGIPDRWRASAWHSFLSSSAKKRQDMASDEQIIKAFHKLLQSSSADDVQIDIDVPRTINSHIMFRRRYRGGQRLLFRVLHSLSLYFPKTGYVQGMASLAATLLCYYDEEMCFVMLVRMWSLRGLDKLYEAGFLGLMSALDEFQKQWLTGNKEVSQKLTDLSIEPTAYGTRWYLTLFNYSIPFPAQLRVWDVFMLLGDPDPSPSAPAATPERPFCGQLDVLHATSAALIDGTREILLDSDFENAMKVLTSWIPVKDEELLMKVAGAEYRQRRKRR